MLLWHNGSTSRTGSIGSTAVTPIQIILTLMAVTDFNTKNADLEWLS